MHSFKRHYFNSIQNCIMNYFLLGVLFMIATCCANPPEGELQRAPAVQLVDILGPHCHLFIHDN